LFELRFIKEPMLEVDSIFKLALMMMMMMMTTTFIHSHYFFFLSKFLTFLTLVLITDY
jgi:hypothetical protein